MSEYKIEKNIPPPVGRSRAKYPFSEMKIGDSILDRSAQGIAASPVANAARTYSNRSDRKFTARVVDDGVRVWRIE